jgi:hypothetical protein
MLRAGDNGHSACLGLLLEHIFLTGESEHVLGKLTPILY